MHRREFTLAALCTVLAACDLPGAQVGGGGVYQIRERDHDEITQRMLDSVNTLRRGAGAQPVDLSPALTASAQLHANDMSRQQRAWPFGSDGASPYDRLRRGGYGGALVGEAYAQTFETEMEILAAWVENGAWGDQILDPAATDMGFAWHQDQNGLIWWAITMGNRYGNPSSTV
ncbi:MAG: CAP domain-containing protein [Qingshengfaniella sp.]